jgi:hypothetical protein
LGKIGEHQVLVDQRVYNGKLDTPKGRKGKNTSRHVALSPGTMDDVKAWRSFLSDRSPEAFLFPSETGRTPLRADNLWKRHFDPRLELSAWIGSTSKSFVEPTPVFPAKRMSTTKCRRTSAGMGWV